MIGIDVEKANVLLKLLDEHQWTSEHVIADELPMTPLDWDRLASDCRFIRAKRAHGRHSYRLSPHGVWNRTVLNRNEDRGVPITEHQVIDFEEALARRDAS